MDYDCQKCGDFYSLESDLEPTTFCNTCAQTIIEKLIEIVPQPPIAITYERGVEILNTIQAELYK